MSSFERSNVLFNQIQSQFIDYPHSNMNILSSNISIYHISRDLDSKFYAFKYDWSKDEKWKFTIMNIDYTQSNLIFYDGSGAEEFFNIYNKKYKKTNNEGTSRNIFQCFCDMLFNSSNFTCGGSPQLVGLYRGRKFNGLNFGIIRNNNRYLLGSPVGDLDDYNLARWYNDNFEICDGNTLERKKDAMRQPNPNL
jgi:hypothetical protein